jgi:hypothetical protein
MKIRRERMSLPAAVGDWLVTVADPINNIAGQFN